MRRQVILMVVLLLYCSIQGAAQAQGLFDFLDPCIGAKQAYWYEHGSIVNNINFEIEATNSAAPSERFKQWWWEEKKIALVPYYEREIWPILSASGATNKFGAFEVWMNKQIEAAGGVPKLDQLMTNEYRRLRHLVLERQRGVTLQQLDDQRQQLYGSCPEDVANQIFRGAVVILGAPVGVVTRNMEIAKRESGEIAKATAVATGISIGAIQDNGILGGPSSEARKACDGIARVFGGKC